MHEREEQTRVEHQNTASKLPPNIDLRRRSASSATPETYRDQDHHQRTTCFKSCPFISVFQALKSINRLSKSHPTPFATNTNRRRFSQIRNTKPTESFKSSSDEIPSVKSHHQIQKNKTTNETTIKPAAQSLDSLHLQSHKPEMTEQ